MTIWNPCDRCGGWHPAGDNCDGRDMNETSLEAHLDAMAWHLAALERAHRSGDNQSISEYRTKYQTIKGYILRNYRHRKGESLAEIMAPDTAAPSPGGSDIREALERISYCWNMAEVHRIANEALTTQPNKDQDSSAKRSAEASPQIREEGKQ